MKMLTESEHRRRSGEGGEMSELIRALRSYTQADADGVMVTVSRQACDEAADRIAALESELAQARAEREQAIAEVECLWVAIQSHCSAATIKAIESELESK